MIFAYSTGAITIIKVVLKIFAFRIASGFGKMIVVRSALEYACMSFTRVNNKNRNNDKP